MIKKIFLIKNDGSEEQLAPFATVGDGLDIPDIWESAVLKYRGQYSNVQIVDKDGNSLTYDPTSNTKQIFTIEYAEKPSITLLFLPNMEEKDQYENHKPYTYAINASSDKKVEITIDNTIDEISGPVVEMRLQANEPETFPAEVKIVKIAEGNIELAFYQSNPTTVEGLQSEISTIQSRLTNTYTKTEVNDLITSATSEWTALD